MTTTSAPETSVAPAKARSGSAKQNPNRHMSLKARFRRDWVMLLLMVPGLAYLIVFFYVPMAGNVIAFQDYLPFVGIRDSAFVGFDNFIALAQDEDFWNALRNTLVIAGLQLVLFFPVPLGLALVLNSILSPRIKRFVQSVVYLPHFISWVLVIALFQRVLGGAGLINGFLRQAGLDPINIMSNPDLFKFLVTAQVIWKDTGWGTIIFLAALVAVDTSLYEAAAVDGASKRQRLWHVTLPAVRGVAILLLILRLGDILTVGFEQMLLQRDAVGAEASDVLDTFVYYNGVLGGDWSTSAAAGLAKGIVGMFLIIGANKLAHMFGESGVYQK